MTPEDVCAHQGRAAVSGPGEQRSAYLRVRGDAFGITSDIRVNSKQLWPVVDY